LREKVTWGAFYSTENSEIIETGTNGKDISKEMFHKIRKLSTEKRNIPEIQE